MRYFCTTPKHLEEVFALPRMLMIKTLLTIWGNISALVPTHTMIATHYICLGWSLLHLLHLEVYASSFVLKVFLLRLGAFYFELVNERERERERKKKSHA